MKQRKFTPNINKFAPDIPLPQFKAQRDETEQTSNIESPTPIMLEDDRIIKALDVLLIDPNPLAPREVYTPQMILERANDLRNQGQHDPIHVIPNPDFPSRYIICDGWTRVQACIQHKVFDTLLTEIHLDLTLQESAWFGYEQNEGRQQHCDLDRAMFYEKLILSGETAAEISRRAQLSKAMMSYYRAYARLPEDVLEIIRQQPQKFGSLVAYNLARLHEQCGLRKTVALAGKFASEDQTVRWLTNQVQSLLHPKEHKTATHLKHIRYANGYLKQSSDAFQISITVPAEKRDAFAQALEDLLDTVAVQTKNVDAAEVDEKP